jgi:two-component system OmpR family sensor kinase
VSIRLRLTILYSAVLALTLLSFSGLVYAIQAESTLNEHRVRLTEMAQGASMWRQRGDWRPETMPPPPVVGTGGHEVGSFRSEERDVYLQYISPEGEVVRRSENMGDVDFLLSDEGLASAQDGVPWGGVVRIDGTPYLTLWEPIVIDGEVTEILMFARSLADREQYLAALRRILLAGGGVAIVTAFGVGWFFAGTMLRPIHRVTQTARAIGVERDFGRRVEYSGPNDEIGQLASTFNTMLAELQAAYQQVERSLQHQRQFVADVSHELRTPLTTIRGNLALLRRQPAIQPEDRDDILADLAGESDRLIRLVNDLLVLARAESGRMLRSEPVWIKPLIEDVCRQAGLLDPDCPVICDPLIDVAVVGDQDALKQVLLILMDNALKHAAGPVTVTTRAVDPDGLPGHKAQTSNPKAQVAISIRDTGPGIAPDVLPHVFERFYRGDEARAKSGIGLGLPIAKALVEAQHGTLSLESQTGRGTVATVILPKAAARLRAPHHGSTA